MTLFLGLTNSHYPHCWRSISMIAIIITAPEIGQQVFRRISVAYIRSDMPISSGQEGVG